MKHQLACMMLIATLAACGSDKAQDATTPTSETAGVEAPSPEVEAAPAVSGNTEPASDAMPAQASAPPFAVNEGDRLKVAKQADCHEVGAGASDSPWTMFPGVSVEYHGSQDGKAKVSGASGKICLIAWDALTKS